ncbi:MAG: hypothetical protein ACRCXC_00310 [Legionella sp.]
MWHIDLLHHLAKKTCRSNKRLAAQFIELLFNLFEEIFEETELELPMVLGFIKDLYLYSEINCNRDVPLAEFARQCVGLFILHTKSCDDYKIWVDYFLPFVMDAVVFITLGWDENTRFGVASDPAFLKKFIPIKKELLKKLIHNVPINIPQSEEVILFNDELYPQFQKELIQIEREVFKSLDYSVSITSHQLIELFRILFTEVDNPYEIVSDLLFYLSPLEGYDQQFDEFILEVKKISNHLLPPDIHSIYIQLDNYVQCSYSYMFSFFFVTQIVSMAEKLQRSQRLSNKKTR